MCKLPPRERGARKRERGRKRRRERRRERLTEERKEPSLVQIEEDLAIFPGPPSPHTEVVEVSLL